MTLGAVIELRGRLFWRKLRGKGGVAELAALVMSFVVVIPGSLGVAVALAWGAWQGTSRHPTDFSDGTHGVLFGLWQLWTLVAISLNDRELFDLRRLLMYPISPAKVYALGVVSGVIADPVALAMVPPMAGAVLGAAFGRPGPWILGMAAALFAFGVATVALLTFVSELFAKISQGRRGREAVVIIIVSVGLLSWAAGTWLGSPAGRQTFLGAGGVGTVWKLRWIAYPPAFASAAVTAFFKGRVGEGASFTAGLFGISAVISWLSYRLALSSARSGGEGGGASGSSGKGLGWRLGLGSEAFSALFEKELKMLARNPVGKMGLFLVPAFAAFLGFFAGGKIRLTEGGEALSALPLFGFAAYVHLVFQPFWVNSLGWERGGVRGLFLYPAPLSTVFAAKNASLHLFSFLTWLVSVVVYAAFAGPPPVWAFVAGAALHLGLGAPLYSVGNAISVIHPKAAQWSFRRGGTVPALSALVAMIALFFSAAIFALPALLALYLDSPWVLVGLWAALGALGFVGWRTLLSPAARLLERRKEQVVSVVAGDDL